MVTPTEEVKTKSENYKAPFLKRNLRNISSSGTTANVTTSPTAATSIPSTDTTTSAPSELGPSGARTPRELAATSPATASTTPASSQAAARLTQVAEGCLVAKHNLELKVCVNTYKVFYTQGTEDYMLGKGWFAKRDERRES